MSDLLHKNKSPFIVFEGLDGSGKSTHARFVAEGLKNLDQNVYFTAEPTDKDKSMDQDNSNVIGKFIRELLLGKLYNGLDSLAFQLLYISDRVNHTRRIKEFLNNGTWVVGDRYKISSLAYLTIQYGIDSDEYRAIEYITDSVLLNPDLTIFLDVDPQECFSRLYGTRNDKEFFDRVDYFKKIRETYTSNYFIDFPGYHILNANGSVEETKSAVWNIVSRRFNLQA